MVPKVDNDCDYDHDHKVVFVLMDFLYCLIRSLSGAQY